MYFKLYNGKLCSKAFYNYFMNYCSFLELQNRVKSVSYIAPHLMNKPLERLSSYTAVT